jgi:hypothetical protein
MSRDKNPKKPFSAGYLEYEVKIAASPDEVINLLGKDGFSGWHDGYVAFSKGEKRLKGDTLKASNLNTLLTKPPEDNGLKDVEGYLMEIDLWRTNGGWSYEEISIEREDRGFFCQKWTLYTSLEAFQAHSQPNCYYCYYRQAETMPILQEKLFDKDDLLSMEVIVPAQRLHFFITSGSGDRQTAGNRQ